MDKTHFANEEIEEVASKGVEYPCSVSVSDINCVVSDIRENLKSLGPPLSCECCIYKVPKKLRKVNEAAYTPHVVSIGPLHHGKKTLKKMEKHKLQYLDKFLTYVAETVSLENFVSTIKERESSIRCCYAETFDYLSSDKFVKMILVDASFIIWLFLTNYYLDLKDQNDSVLYRPWLAVDIRQDLMLLENQLPFFIIQDLYSLAFEFPSSFFEFPSFFQLTCHYFSPYNIQQKSIQPEEKVKHFTDLLRYFLLAPDCMPEIHDEPQENEKSFQQKAKRCPSHCNKIHVKPQHSVEKIDNLMHQVPTIAGSKVSRMYAALLLHCGEAVSAFRTRDAVTIDDKLKPEKEKDRFRYLYSATELYDAGVKFEVSNSKCLLNIKFSRGVLKIPCLELDDVTESYIRNLMAWEQCHDLGTTDVCDYVVLMDYLINTAKDVDLLIDKKIIVNNLGDRVPVANLFNKLCIHIVLSNANKHTGICEDLTAYYNVPCHKWKAILHKEYLSTPWRFASTVAAIVLLVLTLTQTICSIISL